MMSNKNNEIEMNKQLIKQFVKNRILRPWYRIISKISPSFAIKIKTLIYRIKNKIVRLDTEKNKVNDSISNINILIDSTVTSKTEITTGIQRVVKKMISNFSDEVIVGSFDNNLKYVTNYEMQTRHNNIEEKIVNIESVKKLVLLDSSWTYKEYFEKQIDTITANNGQCYSIIYDLIPIRYPEYVVNKEFENIFINWHDMVLQKTDHVMCISKAVADDVIDYYNEKNFKREKPLAISYFPLGADLQKDIIVELEFVRKELQRFFDKPTFLMVGTIEPRKGHMIALEAFTRLLDAGENINLLIIGHNGWNNDDIRNYICNSKYNKTNILWLEDASDYELNWAYQKSTCLIAASLTEGYGLPLIEGAQHGIPIICSDIPVFREVSQGYADFFKVYDTDDLVECIKNWLQTKEHPDSKKIKIYTWKEASDVFMKIVNEECEPYRIIK